MKRLKAQTLRGRKVKEKENFDHNNIMVIGL